VLGAALLTLTPAFGAQSDTRPRRMKIWRVKKSGGMDNVKIVDGTARLASLDILETLSFRCLTLTIIFTFFVTGMRRK
jgi:hypothetical protein